MNVRPALLAALFATAGCAGPMALFSSAPLTVDTLEGNYRRIAACTYERLDRREGRLRRSEAAGVVRIAFDPGTERSWELSFIDEEGGGLTRVEMTSPRSSAGAISSEHALAIARACAA
jgi:hypothetical protein